MFTNAKTLLFLFAAFVLYTQPARAGDTEPPVPVRMVPPVYPDELRRDGMSGIVMVKCLIDEKGIVTDAQVEKSSNHAFSQPAVDAVKRWKFKPAKKDGAAIALHVTIPIQFNLDN